MTDITRHSLPVTLAVSLLVSSISGTAAAVISAYSLRDKLLDQVHHDISQSADQQRVERIDLLRHYVSSDSFKDWQQQERIRSDRQYYSLLNSIERLGDRVGRR